MKLTLAIVLSVVIGCAVADKGCDSLERFKVKHQWGEVFGTGHRRLEFAVKIFVDLFKDHPETKALFTRVNAANVLSPEFEAHAERVIAGIDITIGLLDDEPALKAHLAHLKSQHDGRNIKPEYYTFLAQNLVELMPKKLGTRVDLEAWRDCLTVIVNGIRG